MDGWDRWRGQSRMLERIAAAILGLAVGFACWTLVSGLQPAPRGGFTVLAVFAAFALALMFLDWFGRGPRRASMVARIQLDSPGALLLRLQDVLAEASAADESNELLLDDPLPTAVADSRVVQLFQPMAIPTAGELQARIERHLDSRPLPESPADHSDELFEALASLKRSLG